MSATRTQSDPKYAESNRRAMKRAQFYKQCAVEWLKENRPDIAKIIEAEAYKRFPSTRNAKKSELLDFLA